ncbi:EpsI family protein [bacterium]|nr:EpsI family protein [bacterium]
MSIKNRLMWVVGFLVIGLGGQTLLARHLEMLDEGRPSGPTRPLAELPNQIGDWVGSELPANPEILAIMKLDDYLQRVYRHPSGEEVVLWISHSSNSRDAYHYPTVCMQGNGWEEEESLRATLAVTLPPKEQENREESLSQVRFRFVKEGQPRQFVYYWYYLIGESSIDEAMRRLSHSTRLFLRGRTNGSMTVEIFSRSEVTDPVLMDEFAKKVALELNAFLPEKTRAECELGANL